MRDLATKWPAVPDWHATTIESPDISIRTLSGLSQLLVSGDLDAWARLSGIPASGADQVAAGDRYAVRLARDRILAVSEKPLGIAPGWHVEGLAVSTADTGLHVFEISGGSVPALLARATVLDPTSSSASAALLFAGVNAVAYRNTGTLRVHVDRALATHLWSWFKAVVPSL